MTVAAGTVTLNISYEGLFMTNRAENPTLLMLKPIRE